MDAPRGFEPRLTEPESVALPQFLLRRASGILKQTLVLWVNIFKMELVEIAIILSVQ